MQPFGGMSPAPAGLWNVTWVGVGGSVTAGAQVIPQSVRVLSLTALTGKQNWYAGLEELKSRLGESYLQANAADDYELTTALRTATGVINRYCGTHFNQITEARTFAALDIYHLPIDQVVPGSITAFNIDYDGDGIFETPWTEGQNYQVLREGLSYNVNDVGVPRPQDWVTVLLTGPGGVEGGQFLPFIWPFTHMDRVQIIATWGWAEVPPEISEACLLLATDYFKSKDAPFGIAGVADIGQVRVQQSPWVIDLLRPYIFPRKKFGV
jgi:hypothetical protein